MLVQKISVNLFKIFVFNFPSVVLLTENMDRFPVDIEEG